MVFMNLWDIWLSCKYSTALSLNRPFTSFDPDITKMITNDEQNRYQIWY